MHFREFEEIVLYMDSELSLVEVNLMLKVTTDSEIEE
mgnify:CR=1 FL=1